MAALPTGGQAGVVPADLSGGGDGGWMAGGWRDRAASYHWPWLQIPSMTMAPDPLNGVISIDPCRKPTKDPPRSVDL